MNREILQSIPGDIVEISSFDSVPNNDDAVDYPAEFLNSLEPSGVLPHLLKVKVGVPVVLMRNLDPPRLCNGTRLCVREIGNKVIRASIMMGVYKGEEVLIPQIPIIPTDLPFLFKRRQFPLKQAFAMTITRAQGQTLKVVGVNLEKPCFSHGQFYVACSRVSSRRNLHIYAPDNRTSNIVYHNAL